MRYSLNMGNSSSTAIDAMTAVFEHLVAGDIVGAQAIVLVIEKQGSSLPSSVVEKVLRAAMKAGCLTDEYSEWCARAYGRNQFIALMASICAEA